MSTSTQAPEEHLAAGPSAIIPSPVTNSLSLQPAFQFYEQRLPTSFLFDSELSIPRTSQSGPLQADEVAVLAPAASSSPTSFFTTPSPSIFTAPSPFTAFSSLRPTRSNSPEVSRAGASLENSKVALYNAYSMGQLPTRSDSGSWEVECPDCGTWVSSGIKASRLFGAGPGHFNTLETHRSSPRKCVGSRAARHAALASLQSWRETFSDQSLFSSRAVTAPPTAPPSDPFSSNIPLDSENAWNASLSIRRQRSSSAPVEAEPPTSFFECPGLPLDWPEDLGNFNDSFPWSRIGDGKDALPFFVTVDKDSKRRAFSNLCSHKTADAAKPCIVCADLVPRLERIVSTARETAIHSRHTLLNTYQLRALLSDRSAELNRWKLKMLNMARKISVATRKADDHRRFVMAIAEYDVPRVHTIVETALRNGASISKVVSKIQSAIEGLYRPNGYTTDDLDVATLIYRMGGRSLLYAMSQWSSLPSLRTLRNHTIFTRIMPTVGRISQAEIDHNIQEVVIKARKDADSHTIRHGLSLLIDEVALEESAVYFRHANCVGGLCWKHSNTVDLVLHTFQSAVNIARALANGTVHMGKEMTVASLSFFGVSGTYPILAAPTCKQENAEDMQFIFELILKSWKESSNATTYGDIWSIATDGDATRRAAGFNLCCRKPLSPSSPLNGILSDMPGLNLFTGDNEETLDFDYKHIFKRICTLIRSPAGTTLNGGRMLTSSLIERYLVMFGGKTVASARTLLNPDDPQDVPRAIDLMKAIIALGRCRPETMNPGIIADMDAIRYLASILDAILNPFINTSLSLNEQVVSLSKFSHLIFASFRINRLSFMSNQLYFDSQTMVKNMVFCIAKQQKLDPMACFYLFELGDNRLENLFGRIRMLGAHNSGFSFRQGVERLGHAIDINRVFLRQPNIDIGHRRLSMSRKEGVDHLNATSWEGDVRAFICNLPSAWAEGREVACTILQDSQMAASSADFLQVFSDPGIDMLRPFGYGIYPGINTEPATDNSLIDLLIPSASDKSTSAPTPTAASDDDDDDNPGLSLEDAFDEVPELALPTAHGVNPDDYLLCNNKSVHKMSICRLVITPDYVHKSNNRPERVCGYSKFGRQNVPADLNSDSITPSTMFISGDLYVALIRSAKTLSLAVMQSSGIREGGSPRTSVPIATMLNLKADVRIEGQVMVMRRIPTFNNAVDSNVPDEPAQAEDAASPWSWIWNDALVQADGSMRAAEHVVTEKTFKLSLPGHLVRAVNADIVSADGRIADDDSQHLNSRRTCWILDDGCLNALTSDIWETIVAAGVPLETLPALENSPHFPYVYDDDKLGLICEPGTLRLETDFNCNVDHTCHFCGESISGPVDHWRGHIGRHILHKMRGTGLFEPPPERAQIGDTMPCGFCGLSGNPRCEILLSITARKISIECNCTYAAKIPFRYANKGTSAVPCRNAPIVCALCPHPPSFRSHIHPAVWRYNMPEHIRTQHSEFASPGNPMGMPLLEALWEEMKINESEEHLLGIPGHLIPSPFEQILQVSAGAEGGSAGPSTALK